MKNLYDCKNICIIWMTYHLYTIVRGSSCPSTQLHVSKMCHKDYYSITRFLFLDFSNARNFPLQSCNCTLKIKENGTLSFISNATPNTSLCGSQIDVIIPRLEQSSRFKINCSGNLTLSVYKDDSVLISVHNVDDQRIYDTHYCYSVSLPNRDGFTISCPQVVQQSAPTSMTSNVATTTSQTTTSWLKSESSTTMFPLKQDRSSTSLRDNVTYPSAERYAKQSEDTNISWYIVGGSLCGVLVVFFLIIGSFVIRRKFPKRSRKSDYLAENQNSDFVIEEVKVDEGDGLKENIVQHPYPKLEGIVSSDSNMIESDTQYQPREKRSGSVEILKRDSFVLKTKEKNFIVTSSIPMKTEGKSEAHPSLSRESSTSSSFDAMRMIDVRAQRSDSISWRKSATEKDLYYAEVQLDSVTTTVVMVENIQKAQKYEDKIRYSDIMTEL